MKNFIKTLFAVIFGNAIFFGLLFFCFILLIVGLSMSGASDDKPISTGDILRLRLNGAVTDLPQNNETSSLFGNNESALCIHDIYGSIIQAANDEDIKALWIDLNLNGNLSYSQIDLLRSAIAEFKKTKKPVIAYGEMVSQKSYYLGAIADKVYVNPNGGLDVRGFGAQLTFFKNTLDKLEIEPQIFYAGKFKSATEPLRLDKMSEENKTQTKALLQDISDVVLPNIAHDRNISLDSLSASINQMKSNMPDDAMMSKLIDGEKYIDEVEAELKKTLQKEEDNRLKFTTISDYIDENSDLNSSETKDIAVYVAEGDIIDGNSTEGSIGSNTVVRNLRKMADDDDIKGVVLRINSPGGSALASAVMLREIELLQKKKPVVVSMGNVAASGGYYIASSAERIFAETNTITGSIGVFGIIPNVGKMLQNKVGLTFDEVELNDHAVVGITKNLDAAEGEKITREIEGIYHEFKTVVATGRKMNIDSVESIAQGRVWSGARAKTIGLVDEIGGLKEAISYLATKTKTPAADYFFFNKEKNEIEQLFESMNGESMIKLFQEKFLKSLLGDYYSYFYDLKQYTSLKGSQMRMTYDVYIK